MSQVRVAAFGLSVDGFGAGPRQSLDDPLGVGGPALMQRAFTTRTFQQMHGSGGGGGGVATVRQYLQAGLVDEMHLALAPALLGSGEALLAGIDLPALGFAVTKHVATAHAMHVVLGRNRQHKP